MSSGRDASVAARVPQDLRDDLETLAEREGLADLSPLIRRYLREGADRDLGRGDAPATGLLASLDTRPRAHTGGPATERDAARFAWPTANNAKRELLEHLRRLGGAGVTSSEAVELVGYSGQRRLNDLKHGGWVEVLHDRDGQPVRRKTPRGAWADVYVLTPAAHRALEAETRSAAA